ncbi:LysR family transcriptional regulator [Dickeya dadantii]|uniref:Probable transcription regulator protein n=1 Tax=Dickeya dadantii (strain 3937) TaxID=198628 RepID=E0SLN6_DICD3|nr:LysR family transcriptional regulator [Dickeya dadantii]ADM96870.1 Probable transcription regulator protein [Dickeya dadantii 3937]NAT78222.1 LysR family transcriptional regulator [Dickeya dadantii]NPE53754.1 LysR family transcriptional regulator [Dickeya dadantii]NPE62382.1 LysR family transcriptional regulator [Dickeya dadantii]UAY96942.1 LysR family transcriptional regulator [Dickeya dadantii]
MDQVQAMRVFVRIVEAESFSRAAEKLGLPRATVSQTLKRLELRLGVRLLQRTTRQVQVTDEGMLYYQRCVQLLAEIEETDALFSRQRQQPSGRVRIDMPHSLARQVVIPSLPEFYRRYPQISLVLSANDSAINVMREGVDCVLRAWQVDDDSLVARSLPSLPQVTCASAAYCAEFGVPDTLEALMSHRMVGYFSLRTSHRYPLEFMQQGQIITRTLPSLVEINGADAYIAACQAGMGIIQAPRYGLVPLLSSGELVEILPQLPPPDMPLYVMYPSGRFLAPRIRVVIEWLAQCFQQAPFV